MKYAVAVLIVILSVFPVFSDSYSSNELGQIVDYESPYTIDINKTSSLLSKDGSPVTETITVANGNTKTVTIRNLEDESEIRTVYENGYLKSVDYRYSDGTSESTSYIYSDGYLVCTEHVSAEGDRTVEYYLRNAADSSLFAVRRYENTTLIGTDYIYTDENYYTKKENLIVNGNFDFDEGGNIMFTRDGVVYTYGPDSKLLKEEGETSIKYYEYDGDAVSRIRTETKTKPFTKTVVDYINGSPSTELTYVDGVISQKIDYKTAEGMVKTVYTSGIPVAKVYYRSDNKKVARVEYI